MILQSWNLYKIEYGDILILDNADIKHIFKDKRKLNKIIKSHPITQNTFCFSLKSSNFLKNFYLGKGCLTRNRSNCRLSVKTREEKTVRTNSIIMKKMLQISKVLISTPETSRFFRRYDCGIVHFVFETFLSRAY